MRRTHFPSLFAIPLTVVCTVLVLGSRSAAAQQTHEHQTAGTADQSCACCGNSGTTAMNHADGGGCCSTMGNHAAATPPAQAGTVDHSTMNHEQPQAGAVDHSTMNHEAPAAEAAAKPMTMAGGCCAGMSAMNGGSKPSMPGNSAAKAAAGCCGNMAAATAEPAAPAAPPAADTAPKAPGVMSGCPTTADAPQVEVPPAKADPAATAAAGCCAGSMKHAE